MNATKTVRVPPMLKLLSICQLAEWLERWLLTVENRVRISLVSNFFAPTLSCSRLVFDIGSIDLFTIEEFFDKTLFRARGEKSH